MGQQQPTGFKTPSARTPRFPPRECHRKGCQRSFLPRQWNQRYCREPECLRLLHRWQAAKRQQRRRSWPESRRQHAQAERQRRIRRREEAHARQAERSARISSVTTAGDAPGSRAWSRSERIVGYFLRSSGLLLAAASFQPCSGPLLRRPVPPGRTACPGPRAQVEAA